MKAKKFLTIICAVCLLFIHSIPVLAAIKNSVIPMWDNVRRIVCDVSFSGTSGTVECTVTGMSGTTSISGTATLYEGDTEIDSWNVTGTRSAFLAETFTGKSGKTYRLELEIDVTRNGVVEPISVDDTATCP